MVLLQLKGPLEHFVKRRKFLPGSGFLRRCNMTSAVESNVKLQTFLPLPCVHSSLPYMEVLSELVPMSRLDDSQR